MLSQGVAARIAERMQNTRKKTGARGDAISNKKNRPEAVSLSPCMEIGRSGVVKRQVAATIGREARCGPTGSQAIVDGFRAFAVFFSHCSGASGGRIMSKAPHVSRRDCSVKNDSTPGGVGHLPYRLNVLLGGLGIVAAYFGAAVWLKVAYDPIVIAPSVSGRIVLLQRPFIANSDSQNSVIAIDHWFKEQADTNYEETNSNIVLYEDGIPLGPGHTTPHEDIATEGHGRFTHWRDEINSFFLFSSSDNTDPRTNGRTYWAVDGSIPPEKKIQPKPRGKIVVRLHRPFEMLKGSHLVVAHDMDELAEFADDEHHADRSPVKLFEDGRQLGMAHSSHRAIADLGKGRYSHWKSQGMVFSSIDNSDPNRNGRAYWAVLPEEAEW
jgi:hypothetical protein